MTKTRTRRDFETYFQKILILKKSEKSEELEVGICLRIILPLSRLLRSSIGGHAYFITMLRYEIEPMGPHQGMSAGV